MFTIQAALIILEKGTTFKEQLFDRIFLYAFKQVASSLSKGKTKKREGSVLVIKHYKRLMTKELMSVCVGFGLTKEETGKLFYHRFLKRIGDFTIESMTSSPYRTENSLLRMNRLLKVLRLCTNSCWFFADQCVKRVFPRIHSLPYTVKYKQGTKLNVSIINPTSYQVNYFKRLSVDSEEKYSSTPYVLKVPFCWTVQTLSDGWKGALKISSKPSFPTYLDPIDRWQAIYQLLHWELPEKERDSDEESNWITSQRDANE